MATPSNELEVLTQKIKNFADRLQPREQENTQPKTERKALNQHQENLELTDDDAYQKTLEEKKKKLKDLTELVKGNQDELEKKLYQVQQQQEAFMQEQAFFF